MTPLPVRLLPEARQEFDEAIEWYAHQNKSLAIDFVTNIRNVLNRIAVLPKMHRVVYRDVRKAVVKRFPFVVVYREEATELIVVSIIHTARHDDVWKQRVN
ncbi:MAG: type II toxin-antitoxin system RelE/ParE family toxin [Gemmatales bacterium]